MACCRCGSEETPSWGPSYCKPCYNSITRERYYRTRDKMLAKSRKRYQNTKDEWRERTKRSRAKYPEKARARTTLRRAVREGKVKRLPCEVCGKKQTHGHHTDYSKPLEVMWLCATHHYEQHRKHHPPSPPRE